VPIIQSVSLEGARSAADDRDGVEGVSRRPVRAPGKLATTRADGRPHVVPIWFVLDGDDLVFNTGADTVKDQNRLGISASMTRARPSPS
jgi:hypothetical protein